MKYESQLQITTAAAVPPLTVNQTALVTNFNADLLDGQHGAYYATAASLSGYLPLTGGTLTGTLTGTIGVFTTVRATELTSLLGSNGPITITPDGTGHVHINSTDIRLGPNNTNATLATRGTGDLILRTNEGSAVEGYIKIFDGANGNIEITPNGTGTVVVGKLSGSTASFSGQITSTVATGTAPFVVTSTTRVNNLNVQYLDGQLSTYYAAASSLASYLPLSGGQMTGALTLHSTGTNGFYNGTGDAATYALYNFKLGGWNGMALENLSTGGTYPSQVVGVIDFRSGTIDMKGGFKVNGASVITENQSITISGDASGTGKTAINLTLSNVGTAGTYRSVTTDAKGRVTAGTNPTTLAGYGITDALPITGGTLTGGLSGTTGSFSGALSISGTVQAGFSRLKVLDYNNNGTPTNGIRIATNIPQTSGVGMYTLIFEGYRYGDSNPEMWAVSFYIYNAGAGVVFYNVGGTCWGGKYPSLVQLGWVGGLANIFILTDLVYFRRFTVRAVAGNMSESTSHFEGWSASDSNPTLASATGVVTVPFNNEFGNVAVKGALSSTGAITQAGNQVVHAGNVSTYALPIGGGTLAGNLTINGHLTMGSGYQHRASDGSAAAPGYSFNAETGTGMYRSGTNTLAFATGGVLRASIDGSGNLTATGAVTATNFSGPGTGLTGTAASLTAGAVAWTGVTGKPTTLSGYGITDALPLSGGTLTGGLIGTSANFSGTFIQTGEALAVDACAIVHNTNVESYYQLSRRLQAFSHLGSTTTLEIEAVTLGGGNYSGEAQRTTWRISSRGALYVTRHDEHGGVGKVSLKILNDTAVPDANGQDAKYVVGLVCGNTTDFVMVWMRARFLQDSGTSRWVTIARLATAAPSTVSGSAMTYSSGWIANTGFTNTSFTEVVPAGKFAALALTGVLTSTVATGTAPLVVASTTGVANLNSDLLDGQHGAYYQDAGNLNAGTILAARMPAHTGGDVTSPAGSVALTLANSGVTAGTYTKVTVDAKGRVTTGALLASADLPTYTGTITSGQVTTALGFTPYNATNPSGYITNTATITGYSGGISVSDSRAVVTTPQSINMGVVFDFKQNTTEGLSDGGTYFGEMTFRQYGSTTDWSGGLSHQLGFTDNGNVWQRSGSSTTWGAWKKLLDATNFSSHALPLSGGTLTGQLFSNSKIETTGVVTGSSFSGAGTGLTGTAASLTAGAVPWTGVTGKPTTLAGYGITDALDTSGAAQTKSGNLTVNSALTSGGAFYAATTVQYSNRQQIYTIYYGGAQDLNWKKIADITIGTGLYRGVTFKVDVVDNQGNFGFNSSCFTLTYFATCIRSGGVQDDYNNAVVTGPVADYVRVVKTATGVYELQIRQLSDWQTYIFTAEATINSGGNTVTYASGTPANGSTTGTIYTATPGWTSKLANIAVAGSGSFAGQITSTVATGTAPLVIASTTLVSNLNAQYLNGQLGSYYQNASNLNAGTVPAAQMPAHTGDVTSTAGSVALTIANDTVTNAKLKTMGAGTIKGNNGAVANSPSDLTAAQVATMLSGQTMNIAGSSTSCTGNAASASSVPWSGITSKPTTLSGYGITDALSSTINQQGGKPYTVHDFNTYPSLYDVTFVNPTGSTNLPTGMAAVMSYRFIMGAGDTATRGFDLVGAAEGSGNLYIRERSIGTWSRVLHSNNYNSYALPLTGGTLTGGLSGTTGSFSGEVTWSGWNSGNARAVRIGYSGGNYGGIGYGINYTATAGSHTYAIADAVTRIDLADGIQVYSAATGTVGAAVSWTTLLEATRGNGNLRWKGNTVLDSNNYNSFALPLSGGTMTGNIILPATGYVGLNGGSTFGIGTLATNRNSGVFDTVESTGTDPLELNYYQGGAVKIGSGTYGSKSLYAAGIFDGGNQVLHAGNYTSYILPSYSPTRYLISETGATTQFAYLGRWSSVSQNGQKLKMTVLAAAGYNATASQNQRTELYFKTSNGSSSQTGSTGVYYADGFAYRIGQQNSAPTYFRIVSVDSATFDIYGYFNNFTGASFYEVTVSGGTWTNSGTLATPSGNYIDITPDVLLHSGNYNSYAPTLTGTGASGTWGISISGSAAQLNGQAASYYLNASNLNAGTVPAAQMPAHTGDVTSTSGTVALTIANDTVTNAKLKTMGASTIKGNNGGVANSPSDLTPAQVATMLSGQTMNIAGSSTSCTGNAATATNVAWSGITSKPTTVSGYGITDTIPSLAAVAEADLNTATATGFRLISKTGYSSTLLTINVAGSSGPVQIDANYTGVLRWRNQTDSTTWTAWKTLLHDGNYGGYSTFTGTVTGTNFSGPGTGLTGTAASLTAGSANAIADGTVSTSAKIAASVVTYAKIQNVSVSTVLGNSSASVAQAPVEISMASLAGMLSGQTMNINGSSASCTGNAATATNGFTVKPGWAGAQNLIADLANFNNSVPSGFYQYSGATNSPTATWYNLINVRHSNTGNDHGFQLAMSYYDEVLWSRTYSGGTGANNGTFTTWRAHLHSGNYSSYALPLTGGTVSGQLTISATTDPAILLSGGATADSSTHIYTAIGGIGKVRVQRDGIIKGLGIEVRSGADVNAGSAVFSVSNAGAVVGASFSGAGTGLTGTAASLTAGAVAWTGVTGKPTTISGYGITDIVSSNSGSPVAADTTTKNGFYYVNSNISLFSQTDGALFVQAYDNTWASQIYQDYRTGQLAIRGRNSGTWQAWRTVLDSTNFLTSAPNSGVTAGTYNNVTVNAKGIVTGGSNVSYLIGNQTITLGGDLSGSGTTSITATIANNAVTNAKLNTMGAGTIKGNNGGVANSPSDLTPAQVATMLSGQTMNIAGSSTSCTGNSATATTSTRLSDASNGLRIANPGGGSYATGASTATGAIKIKLPTASFKSNTMFRFTVKIYQYAGGSSGLSRTIEIGGYNYSDAAANWYNIFAYQNTMGGGELNVRFGNDGTSQCVWIGEIATVWDYPQVTVTDFQGGYGNYTDAIWATGWGITFATAFDTVTQGPIVAAKPINSQNYSSYAPTLTGGGASGTWGINITGSSASCTGNAATSSSCSGNAATASAVAASGITGQTGMWTSAARPGPYRLYRRDVNDAYSVQNYWTGTYWRLDGYYSNDTVHAGCSVAYADTAGSASSASSATNSTQLNGQAASYYENRDTTAVGISAGTLTLTRAAGNLTTTIGGRVVAWCDFNGNFASTQTPNANFNVSSITKNATGDYTVNFSSALANANYVVAGSAQLDAPSPGQSTYNVMVAVPRRSGAKATGSCRIVTEYPLGVTLYDSVSVGVAFIAA